MNISLQKPYTVHRASLAFMLWDEVREHHALWVAHRSHNAHECIQALNAMRAGQHLHDAGTLNVELRDIYEVMTSSDERHWTLHHAYQPSPDTHKLAMYAVEHGDLFTDAQGAPFLAWQGDFMPLTFRDGVLAML